MVRPLFNEGQGPLLHPPLGHQQAFLNKVREACAMCPVTAVFRFEKRVQRNIVQFHFIFVFISEQLARIVILADKCGRSMFTGRILLLHQHKLSQVSAICILWIIVCDGKMGFECEICHDRILEGCIPWLWWRH